MMQEGTENALQRMGMVGSRVIRENVSEDTRPDVTLTPKRQKGPRRATALADAPAPISSEVENAKSLSPELTTSLSIIEAAPTPVSNEAGNSQLSLVKPEAIPSTSIVPAVTDTPLPQQQPLPNDDEYQILNAAAYACLIANENQDGMKRFKYLMASEFWSINDLQYQAYLKEIVTILDKIIAVSKETPDNIIKKYITPNTKYLALFPRDYDWKKYIEIKRMHPPANISETIGEITTNLKFLKDQIDNKINEAKNEFNDYWKNLFAKFGTEEKEGLGCPEAWDAYYTENDFAERLQEAIIKRNLSPHEGLFVLLAVSQLNDQVILFLLMCGVNFDVACKYRHSSKYNTGMEQLLDFLIMPDNQTSTDLTIENPDNRDYRRILHSQTKEVVGDINQIVLQKTTQLAERNVEKYARVTIEDETVAQISQTRKITFDNPNDITKLRRIRSETVNALFTGQIPSFLVQDVEQQKFLQFSQELVNVGPTYRKTLEQQGRGLSEGTEQHYATELLLSSMEAIYLGLTQLTNPTPEQRNVLLDVMRRAVVKAANSRRYGFFGLDGLELFGKKGAEFTRLLNKATETYLGEKLNRSFWGGEIILQKVSTDKRPLLLPGNDTGLNPR